MNKLELAFGSISVHAELSHPNRMRVKGVLVRLDEPSDKAPSGAQGHRILVSSKLAQSRLSTLKGMGLNYEPDGLSGHAQRHKVGVIDKAWINGQDLCVEGTIWKHDFPEAEQDLKKPGLGMSMEIGDVEIENSSSPVWTLKDFQFLGATILFKNAAAYHKTLAIAASKQRKETMAKTAVKTKVAAGTAKESTGLSKQDVAQIVAEAVTQATAPLLKVVARNNRQLAAFGEKIEEMELDRIAAGEDKLQPVDVKADDGEDDDDDGEDDGKKKPDGEDDDDDDDDDDEMESESVDKGDLEEMGPELEESEEGDKPGDANKNTRNHGSDTAVDDRLGKDVKKSVLGSAAYKNLKQRFISIAEKVNQLAAENTSLKKQVGKLGTQVIRASVDIGRRSMVDPTSVALLARGNYNSQEILASGQKLGVEQVDAILATFPNMSPVDRMTAKNKMIQSGLMDEGYVQRGIRAS